MTDVHKPSIKAELLEFLYQEWLKVTQQQSEKFICLLSVVVFSMLEAFWPSQDIILPITKTGLLKMISHLLTSSTNGNFHSVYKVR